MRTLISSTFLYESWTAELERRIQVLEMRCYRILLNSSYKDHAMNGEVRNRIQSAIGVHEERETQMVWPHFKILWHGEDNTAGDNGRCKKERKT